MTPRVMGLDLSLSASGVADAEGVSTIRSSLIGVDRLADLEARIFEVATGADLVVLEDYAYSAHAAHAHEIGELGGVIRLALHHGEIPFVTIIPSQLKKFATDRGNAKKVEMVIAARERFGYQGTDDNEAEALMLRAMGLLHYDLGARASLAYQRAVIAKIAWPELREGAA
jgi:crossover junction endodeoxyribonuclease RuvC